MTPAACALCVRLAAPARAAPETGGVDVVRTADVAWEHLNPARGDQSPSAGTLWGDRGGTGATGFLLRPTDGFSSPPHIHNVTYRAFVLRGELHNDDPTAAEMWMPAGSFWTQPRGEPHITSARGSDVLAYVEIDAGPYLVRPPADAFDSGERPVNVDASNLVWVDPPGAAPPAGRAVAYLWGDPRDAAPSGTFLRLPAGGAARVQADAVRAVVALGTLSAPAGTGPAPLGPGSLASTGDATPLPLTCLSDGGCVVYLRAEGRLRVDPAGR